MPVRLLLERRPGPLRMGPRAHFLFGPVTGHATLERWRGLMTARNDRLWELLEPAVAGMGFELSDLDLRLGRGHGLLRLFIDSAQGITLEDCEQVSQQVSGVLDVADPIPGHYSLEVSSPGLDRRLVKPAHFERFMGAVVQVRLARLVDGRRRVQGSLVAHDGEAIEVAIEGATKRFAMADVEMVRLVPDLQHLSGN